MPFRFLCNRALLVICISLTASCSEESGESSEVEFILDIPEGFPAMVIPEENALTESRVELGERLFFDPILSLDGSRSCASCHRPEFAFADTSMVSSGVHHEHIGRRNTPSLANVGYQKGLFMEGGVPSLELQALAPFGEKTEFDLGIHEAAERLKEDTLYSRLSLRAYGTEPHAFVVSRALSAFQRTILSGSSPYDRWSQDETSNALSDMAVKGHDLFIDLGCETCHSGFLFSDQSFHNIGLYDEYADQGRGRSTNRSSDVGKFKTPSLRNVGQTAPYMHDGSISDLEGVLEHYARGGVPHPNRSERIKAFELDSQEREQLLAFLHSLTDSSFLRTSQLISRNLE